MAQVVIGGRREVERLAFGEIHPNTYNFIQQQLDVPSQLLTDAGRQFFANAGQIFEQFNGLEAQRLARAAVRKVEALFQPNIIQPLTELVDLQHASLTMQRWIMAQPDIRHAYHQQRLDGFADTYVDMNPGVVGDQHYDYRRVMHGVVQPVEDENADHDWKVQVFFDELHEGERDLTLEERVDVLTTWDAVRAHLKRGEDDPTSPFGGKQ